MGGGIGGTLWFPPFLRQQQQQQHPASHARGARRALYGRQPQAQGCQGRRGWRSGKAEEEVSTTTTTTTPTPKSTRQKTEAELRFEEAQRRRAEERALKVAELSHKERVAVGPFLHFQRARVVVGVVVVLVVVVGVVVIGVRREGRDRAAAARGRLPRSSPTLARIHTPTHAQEFNRYLGALSDHHDIPRVGPG